MDAPDFVAKYGPLIHIFEEGEEDLETIAEEEGYTCTVGREWRDAHCEAVLGYMRAIRTDYEVLWQQTSGNAANDVWLGKWLGDMEKELHQLERRVRVYVALTRLTPVPRRGRRSRRFRRFLIGLLPAVRRSDVEELLRMMRRIYERGGATIFLP